METDDGPFWLDDHERSSSKFDIILDGQSEKEKTKIHLLSDLRVAGVDTTTRRFLKPELIELCIANNIPITIPSQNIKPGWCNKPKGMLQILFERGWIDRTLVKTARSMRYSKKGKTKDVSEDTGELLHEYRKYSLSYLLSQCKDFQQQKSDLEQLCDEISVDIVNFVSVLFTPKFHCELAGEGIEYSWGASKRYYRRQPITMKRSTINFELLVRDSISKISTMMCRRFSRKARGYMLGYRHQQLQREEEGEDTFSDAKETYEYNEKIHKMYRGHRDANCIDGAFIERVMLQCTSSVIV